MPRLYSNDDEYNKQLELVLSKNQYAQEVIGEYKKFEEKYIKNQSENFEKLGGCIVPQEPYKYKSDEIVCLPIIETKYEDDGSLVDTVSDMLKSDEKTANEMIDCISGDGPNSLVSITKQIKEKSERLHELKDKKEKFDEFFYNARFYEYYLDLKMHKHPVPSAIDPNIIFLELIAKISTYSTGILMTYDILTHRIFNYDVFMKDYADLKKYSRIGTKSDKLDVFKNKSKLKIKKSKSINCHGRLYDKYYKDLSNPIETLFTTRERGVSKRNNTSGTLQPASIDTKGNPISYIADIEKYKNFYSTLDKELAKKKKIAYSRYCGAQIDEINLIITKLVASEGMFLINKKEQEVYHAFEDFHNEYRQLEKEISKIEFEISPEGINSMLSKNPCFTPEETKTSPDVKEDLIGGFTSSSGRDMNNPTFDKNCYWVKFCELATMYGLLPFPEPVNKMRYWGIGIALTTPTGVFNVPMPTIWSPVATASSKFGVFVMMIGQIGIVPHPFVIWINKEGVARFVITMYGVNLNGDIIGFDPNDGTMNLLEKSIHIPHGILSSLKEGVFDIEEMLNIDYTSDVDDDLLDVDELNKLSMESTMQDFNKLMYAFDDKKEKFKASIPVSELFKKISNKLHSEIDKIDLSKIKQFDDFNKFTSNKSMDITEFTNIALDIVYSVELPKIPMIDDVDVYKLLGIPSPSSKFDDMIATLQSMPMPNVNLGDLKQVKQFILNRLMLVINSNKIQEMIISLPEELDLGVEEDFNKVRDFIAKVCSDIIDKVNPMIIHLPTYLNEHMFATLDFSRNFGIGCKGSPIELKVGVDPLTLQMLKLVQSFVETSWSNISYDMVKQYITNRILKRSQLVDFSKYIIEELLPDYEFPFDLNINPYEITKKLIGLMHILSDPKILIEPFYKKLVSKISIGYINFNDFKQDIVKFIVNLAENGFIYLGYFSPQDLKMYLHGIVDLVFNQKAPMFIYKKLSIIFSDVEHTEKYISSIIKETLPNIFEIIDTAKITAEQINKIARIIKLIKNSRISMNSIDSAFSLQTLLDNISKTIKCIVTNDDKCSSSSSLCDIVLAEKAIEILRKTNLLKYPIVAAACWADRDGADVLIRNLHPVAYADDLPPYERLTLNNPLFCLFLDDFCHMSKQYCFFGERYGY